MWYLNHVKKKHEKNKTKTKKTTFNSNLLFTWREALKHEKTQGEFQVSFSYTGCHTKVKKAQSALLSIHTWLWWGREQSDSYVFL